MDWIYIWYGQIMPGDLTKNKDTIQAAYHVKDPIEIIFNQIKTGQKFTITGKFPLSG